MLFGMFAFVVGSLTLLVVAYICFKQIGDEMAG